MNFHPDQRLAVFIDGANLHSLIKSLEFEIDYKRFRSFFADKARLITANYYTALLDDDYSPIRPLMDWLDYNGYHVVSKPAKEQTDRDGRRRIKGNMDIEIAVDMLELAPHIDHIVLVSGDADFAHAVKKIREKGVSVTVVSTLETRPPMLGDALRRQADHFIELVDIERIIRREDEDKDE